MTQRIEVSGHRFRIFLPSRAIALAWELKGSCKGCAHSLLATAKWLVPEAERFLVLRTGSYSHQRRRVIPVTLVSICGLIFGFASGLIVFPDPSRQGIEITQNGYGKRWPFAVMGPIISRGLTLCKW